MAMARSFILCVKVALSHAAADWMGHNFQLLRDKSLLQMTLPGSHNSGNYQGALHSDLLCESDYRYDEYLASSSSRWLQASGRPILDRHDFDQRMIPWNVNHFHPIREQLEEGVRFLHLKVCNFGLPGATTIDLANVRFQHRGYTTRETVASMLVDLHDFLETYPKEIVVLGFNNLHNSGSKHFGPVDIAALCAALQKAIGFDKLISSQQLSDSMEELLSAGRRVAVFVKDGIPGQGIIPSQLALIENWSPVMASGDLTACQAWLLQDLERQGNSAASGHFYVMQANPNNAESKMYEAMNSNQLPASNLEFLRGFLLDLNALVLAAKATNPGLQINVIDSDFLNISRPYATAMQLMGLPYGPEEVGTSSSSWWLRITALCGLGCLLFSCRSPDCRRRLAPL